MRRLLYNRKLAPYVFIAPFLLTLLVFWISPLFKAIVMSTQKILPGSTVGVGFRNYERLMGDRLFYVAMGNSVKYMVLTLILLIPIPMLLAVLINGQPDTEEAYGDYAAAIMPFWFTSRFLAHMPDFAGKIAIAPAPVVDNAFVKYFQNNPFDPLLEIEDSIGNLTSFSNGGMPSVNNLLNTQTLNDIFENGVPIEDALNQAQSDLENELG